MESNSKFTEFRQFLQDELAISTSELAVVIGHRQRSSDPLPMLLWQYGLVSLEQLSTIFDWLDERAQFNIP
jgi:Protein of unknown function (DUF2949)